MTKVAAPADDPLLESVRSVLDAAAILGVRRVVRHPGRRNAIAVRGELLECYAEVLEAAGFEVEREDGWLTVRDRASVKGSAA